MEDTIQVMVNVGAGVIRNVTHAINNQIIVLAVNSQSIQVGIKKMDVNVPKVTSMQFRRPLSANNAYKVAKHVAMDQNALVV